VALSDDPSKKQNGPYSFQQPRGAGSFGAGFGNNSANDGFTADFDRSSGSMGWSGEAPTALNAPQFFDGIVRKRVFAYIIDFCLLCVVLAMMWVVAIIVGIFTFGLGFGPIAAIISVTPFAYHALTIGALGGATIGMRIMGIQVRTLDGRIPGLIPALIMTALFMLSLTFPVVLVIALFHDQRRMLHDIAAQVMVVNKVR
jgi:uncharacterized RDD family membrane protein YckC